MSASGMSPEFEKKLEALAKDLYERGAIIRRNPNAERLPFDPYVEAVEANVAKTMAEVLAEHQQKVGIRDMRSHCWCGWAGEKTGRAFIEHQAAALSAAGYGLVADAKREAWAEGHESGFWNGRESAGSEEMELCGIEHAKATNPYREASNDDQ